MSGEDEVFKFFSEHLPDWELFIQPNVNGSIPDIVVFNPNQGLGVFEVKDWNLTSKDWLNYPSAIKQAQKYRDLFRPIFGARHNELIEFPVTVGLIFTRALTADVMRCFGEFLDGTTATTLSGRDALLDGNIELVFPLACRRNPTRFTEDAAKDLKSWLIKPFHAEENGAPLDDDPQQRRLVQYPGNSKPRRIAGPAGSGKSVTLVRRAAKVASEGKDVLFVCYNASLINYLESICNRTGVANSKQIEWRTFGSFCRSIAGQLGRSEEFNSLAKSSDSWDDSIPLFIQGAMSSCDAKFRSFDAIFVDEGQDFNLLWWNLLRRVLKPDGEMMLAFDMAQNVYGRDDWSPNSMPGAGFSGPPNRLGKTVRLPPRILPFLRDFAEMHFPAALESLPESATGPDHPCDLRWVQVRRSQRVSIAVAELVRIVQRDPTPLSRSITDLTLLCDLNEDCVAAENLLKEQKILVINTANNGFKKSFSMNTPKVKMSSFYSFKGWQSRLLTICVSRFADDRSKALLYTMLTRLKNHRHGSSLTVVSSVPRLEAFASKFPEYESRT